MLRNLPGLRSAENGEGDANYWTSVSKRSFVIEVVDIYRRFQPFSFQADLPAQGLFTLSCAPISSPLNTAKQVVPLYSAPARTVPGAMAVLHADLWDLESFLTQSRKEIDRKYDYRYSVLTLVFGKLIREGRLREEELHGLADDKIASIRSYVNLWAHWDTAA